MSEVRVHIERLVIDGIDLSFADAAVLEATVSSAVEQHLRFDARARAGSIAPSSSAHATLRAPSIDSSANGSALGRSAGRALATALAPVCIGETTKRGSGRG